MVWKAAARVVGGTCGGAAGGVAVEGGCQPVEGAGLEGWAEEGAGVAGGGEGPVERVQAQEGRQAQAQAVAVEAALAEAGGTEGKGQEQAKEAAAEDGLNDLAQMRSELNLQPAGPGNPTLTRLDVDEQSFYGISAHGQPVTQRVNSSSVPRQDEGLDEGRFRRG